MKKAILMGVPHHNNLGDTAIAIAEKKYIEENFSDYEYYEISEETLELCIETLKKYIDKNDILFLHGGGNLGNEYLYVESARRKAVEQFKDNVILMFPQTMFFHNTEDGRKELQISRDIYASHRRLLMVAREQVSFESMKKEFPNNVVIQTPDIVTYLNKTEEGEKRDGALLILRNDCEANINETESSVMDEIVKKYYKNIEYCDTARGEGIKQNEREKKLDNMLARYRKSELVITDRLHGMIFAAITSTPCIAIGNYNHKVKACAQTLNHLNYIQYIESINDELEDKINYLKNIDKDVYDTSFANEQFKKMKEIIDSYINENK